MASTIKARIVPIGNSQGVRIPKILLEQTSLAEEVELEAQGNQIVIRPLLAPRAGWAEQFQLMAERGDDKLLDDESTGSTSWDETEWAW